jgi:hypothetical protein
MNNMEEEDIIYLENAEEEDYSDKEDAEEGNDGGQEDTFLPGLLECFILY